MHLAAIYLFYYLFNQLYLIIEVHVDLVNFRRQTIQHIASSFSIVARFSAPQHYC